MRNLTIGLMVILGVLWAGAVWADKDDKHDKNDKDDFALVPQTGQVISYDANNPPRDDGALQKGVELPTPRFTDKGNGTIKDNLTGLIWLKNANCPGALRQWQEALDDVASLNKTGKMNGNDCGDTRGKKGTHRTDWRLPNVRELFSLVDYAFANPAISNAAGTGQGSGSDPFSNFQFQASSFYWSSTTVDGLPGFAWGVNFINGTGDDDFKTAFNGYVIAVRGSSRDDKSDRDDFAPVPQTGQVICYDSMGTPISCAGTGQDGALQKGVELPTPRFTDKGNGTIKDNLTGLIWLKNANCPGFTKTWQQALDFVAGINNGTNSCGDTSGKRGTHRTDWRLPNVREFFSLVDYAFTNPAISNAAGTGQGSGSDPFSNFQASSFYWSSTTNARFPSSARAVNFLYGDVAGSAKYIFFSVMAVRGGSED